MTPGRAAYEAYCDHRGWKAVNGSPLPAFSSQSQDLQFAWETAAHAASGINAINISAMCLFSFVAGAAFAILSYYLFK